MAETGSERVSSSVMSKKFKSFLWGAGLAVVAVLLLLSFGFGKKRGLAELETETAKLDSLRLVIAEILSRPPDTIRVTSFVHDTVTKWRTQIIHETPPTVTGPYLRSDSLVNEELAVYVLDSIEGRLLWRNFGYKLFVPKTVTETVTLTKEVPVFVDKPVPTYYDGFWISGQIGGGAEFAYSVGLDYSRGKNTFGVNYLRFGGTNNWLVGYSRLIYQRK